MFSKSDLVKCKYPEKMVTNKLTKIKKLPRKLEREEATDEKSKIDAEKQLLLLHMTVIQNQCDAEKKT